MQTLFSTTKMTKEKFLVYFMFAVIFGLFSAVIYKMEQEKCNCITFKKITSVIIHPTGLTETVNDSICVIGGNKKGDLLLKTIN